MSSEPTGLAQLNLHRNIVLCLETQKSRLDFDDPDLFKVTTGLCNFKVWPKMCFIMLSLEIIDGFQPVSL